MSGLHMHTDVSVPAYTRVHAHTHTYTHTQPQTARETENVKLVLRGSQTFLWLCELFSSFLAIWSGGLFNPPPPMLITPGDSHSQPGRSLGSQDIGSTPEPSAVGDAEKLCASDV